MAIGEEQVSGYALIQAIEKKIEKVRTRSLDVSFNELLDMYHDGELIIDPAYQRLFRWSEGSQSRFIESLLLEMPVPPIFVIERSQGVYELIDGLQRISSYMHFRGCHPLRTNDDGTFQSLKLRGCDIAPELNGMGFEDLPKALEIRLKRNFIRVEVLRKESDDRLRYYMFKRLNTGGERLSDHEIRNCTIRLLGTKFNDFIIDCSSNEDFIQCIENVPDEKIEKKFDQELVLRFFAFKNYREHYLHDVGDFMTDYMEAVSDEENKSIIFDYAREQVAFEKTFKILNLALASRIFSATNSKGTLINKFSIYHYEAFTLGVQPFLDRIDQCNGGQIDMLRNQFIHIKNNEDFRRITTGGGKNYSKPLAERIGFVENILGSIL